MCADGCGHKLHPAWTSPRPPCDGEGPNTFSLDGFLRHHRTGIIPGPPPPHQVADPPGYAVAGKILLAAAGALAGVLLALVAMYLYNAARRRRLADTGGDDRDDGAVTPRGLDPAVLRALPVTVVAQGAGRDCAVCLGELQPGDKARCLPRCAHVFHADCIDAWFRGNATCPLCRADVTVAPGADDPDVPEPPPEVRINVGADGAAAPKAASMGRLPSGTDLDKTRRAFFASTRSTSF